MTSESILFPHLHITLSHVGKTVSLFGIDVAYYGIVISIGMVLAGAFVLVLAHKNGKNEDDFLDILIWGLIFGVIGARIYYVIFRWDLYKDNLLSIFQLRQGGLAIYGGIIGGTIAAIVVCRIKKMNFFDAADFICFGLLIGQIFGRWGNFFNREAFGTYTDSLFAMQIPLQAVRSTDDVTMEMLLHMKTIDGIPFISVHPTFLYESLWNLGIFIFLFLYHRHRKFNGELFFWYLMLYGLGRFWIESLRTDQLQFGSSGVAVSQVVAAVLVVVSAVYLLYHYRKFLQKKRKNQA